MAITVTNNYTGSKNAFGVCEFLINHIPFHVDYYELFAGSAVLYFRKRPASSSLIMEKEYSQYRKLFQQINTGQHPVNGCAIEYLQGRVNAQKLNTERAPSRNDFIYLDPPYPFAARRSKKNLYLFEMTDQQHIVLRLGVCYFALQIFQVLDKFYRQNNSTKPLLCAGRIISTKLNLETK